MWSIFQRLTTQPMRATDGNWRHLDQEAGKDGSISDDKGVSDVPSPSSVPPTQRPLLRNCNYIIAILEMISTKKLLSP